MTKARSILENIVVVAIVLVLIQTFLEDYAVLAGWSWNLRRILLFSGLAFDLFFTIEFLTRFYFAFVNRRAGIYFWYERGWIDFIASVPLLLLNSGPSTLAYLSGTATIIGFGAILNVLKVVKAIRIARILRLLRVLKIFARIRNTDSVMAQRHVAKISTVAVSTIVLMVLILTIVFSLAGTPSLEEEYQERTIEILTYVEERDLAAAGNTALLEQLTDINESVLVVQDGGRVVYSRFVQDIYDTQFGPIDYGYGQRNDIRVFFDMRPVNQEQSRVNLIYFGIIVVLVLAFMFYYSPHFALTVSDPIHIMKRGLGESSYNLEVKTPAHYEHDEVYELGELYNEVYLPMKDRATSQQTATSVDLKMDDIQDILYE
ncbi:MAG: ion transporter [Spirochaetales bacterium]